MLFILGQRDGVLMGEAGAALDLGPPGISGLVDRMTAANLIKRRADPDDGRAWRLWLTPAGRAAMAQSKAGLAEINARLTEGFTDAEIEVVARWLTSLQTRFPRGEDAMTEHIKIENDGGILSLTMARPDKKNALTNAMYGALADAIEARRPIPPSASC